MDLGLRALPVKLRALMVGGGEPPTYWLTRFVIVRLLGLVLVELVAPWFAFWPRLLRHVAGALMLAFQVILILSGNLSFLNWLAMVPILACFDDTLLGRVLPVRLVARARQAQAAAAPPSARNRSPCWLRSAWGRRSASTRCAISSSHQAMNTSFNYRYEFTPLGEAGGAWWRRTLLGTWLPPLSADDPRLRRFLTMYGWLPATGPP